MNYYDIDNFQDLMNMPISYFKAFWSGSEHKLLEDVLLEIKSDSFANRTKSLRGLIENKDYKSYQERKKKLPAVAFSGVFERKRNLDSLLHYTALCVLDIDKIEEDLDVIIKKLKKDEYVFALWRSPSQTGLKGLVLFKYEFNIASSEVTLAHKSGFEQLKNYFKKMHNVDLDSSGSDITRLCFLSQDKDILIKKEITPFKVEKIESESPAKVRRISGQSRSSKGFKHVLYNPKGKNEPENRDLIKKIIKFLKKEKKSITYDYDDWLKVGFAVANSFTFDIGQKYYHELSALDNDKYEKNECDRMLLSCYRLTKKQVLFASILRLARDRGFEVR